MLHTQTPVRTAPPPARVRSPTTDGRSRCSELQWLPLAPLLSSPAAHSGHGIAVAPLGSQQGAARLSARCELKQAIWPANRPVASASSSSGVACRWPARSTAAARKVGGRGGEHTPGPPSRSSANTVFRRKRGSGNSIRLRSARGQPRALSAPSSTLPAPRPARRPIVAKKPCGMVGPSGTEAVSPPRPARIPPSSGFALNPSAFEASTSSGAGVSGALGAPIALQLPYPARAEHDDYRPATPTDRTSGSTTGTSRSSRSNSFDLGPTSSSPSATVTAKSTTVLRVRPALRLNSNGGPQIVSVGSSPQRRGPTAAAVTPSTAATTPLSGLSDASQLWKSAPQLVQPSPQPSRLQPSAPSNNEVPVLPDLNLRRADSYDLSRIPEWAPLSPKPKPQATVSGPPSPPRKDVLVPQSSPRPKSRNKEHHRTHSQKTMLASALQKANTAVTLDNAENYEGAMEAYSDACVLLSQVMQRAGGEDDKKKLQTIVSNL